MGRVLSTAAFVVVTSGAVLISVAEAEQQKSDKNKQPEAEKVLSAWAAPGAPKSRNTSRPPEHFDLATEDYTVEQPFQKVWEFYAAKCGEKETYKPGLNLRSGGGDKKARYMLKLVQNAKVPENGYCQFAIHAESYWIVVEIHSPDTQKNQTSVNLIAGAR